MSDLSIPAAILGGTMAQPTKDPRALGVYVVPEIYPPDSKHIIYHLQKVAGNQTMSEVTLTERELFELSVNIAELLETSAAAHEPTTPTSD